MDNKITIGGSEIAAVMGLSRWKTPLRLWAEKRGDIAKDDISQVDAVELGIELEDFVARKFTRKTGLKVRRQTQVQEHKDHPNLVAHIDRLIEGKNELLECKTCSVFKNSEWDGESVPTEYVLQVNWYLGIKGWSAGYIAVQPLGGGKFQHKRCIFDAALYDLQVEAALAFLKMVDVGVAPIAISGDSATLKDLFPDSGQEIKIIDDPANVDEINDMVAFRQEQKMHIANIEKEVEAVDAKIKQVIGESAGIDTGKYKITWQTQVKKIVDSEKLKEAGILEQFQKETKSRYFRVNLNKEAK